MAARRLIVATKSYPHHHFMSLSLTSSNMDVPPHSIRVMTAQDVPECSAIFAEHGIPLTCSLETFRQLEPNGHLVLVNDNDGRIISFINVVQYDPRVSFIGHFATRKEFQGRKLGIKLWN